MHERKDAGEERWRTGVRRKGGMLNSWVAGQADKGKDAGEERWTRGKIQDRRKQEKKEAGKEWRSK